MSQIRADLNLNCEKFLSAIKTVDSAIAQLEHQVVGFAVGFKGLQVVGEAIESQFEHLKQSFELGAKLREMSLNTEQSVSDMLLLRQVFENAGMGAEFSEQAIFNLNKSLAGVNEQGEATKPVFDKLGLSIQALRSLSTVDQLKMIGAAMREVENPADRAKAACDLFGKAGKRMMQLFGESEAFAIAGTQIGGLGKTMEENAIVFKEIEDEMGALSLKGQQFFAGMAQGSSGQLKETLEALRGADFTDLGENIGGVISNALKLAKILYEMRPVLIGIAAAMTANSLAGRNLGGVLAGEIAMGYRSVIANAKVCAFAISTGETAFGKLAVAGRIAFTSLAAGAKALYAALGPIGWGVMLGAAAYQAISGHADKINNATGAVTTIGEDQTGQTRQNFALLKNISSEEERSKAAETLARQLEDVHEKMRKIDEDFSDEKGFDDTGRAQIAESYNRQTQALEMQVRSLSRIPPELIAARAAAKAEEDALEAARKKAEQLSDAVAKARAAMEGDVAKASLEELSPDQQKKKVLDDVGEKSAGDIETQIQVLDEVIRQKQISGAATDQELKQQEALITARRELIGIEKAIGQERKKAAEKAEADAKKAAEEKKKKADQDAKFNTFERDWQLELKKSEAEINGDDATVKNVEHQQRVDRYEKQALDAGEDPAKARKMAEKRATADGILEEMKGNKKEHDGPTVSHLQRIGGGDGPRGVRADPQLRESQRQTRLLEQQNRLLAENNRLLKEGGGKTTRVKVTPVFGS